jgi:hypothetical protein
VAEGGRRTPTPAYRLLDLYFTDYDTASDAAATVEFFPSVIALATGGVRIVFADIEESRGGRARPTIEAAVRAP